MREIKFRGRSPNKKYWYYGEYARGRIFCNDGIYHIDPETVDEFAGFKDVDGVEIYEGDILQNDEYPEEIGKIINENNCWLVEWFDIDDKTCLCWLLDNTPQKVIGNIHDNPELLEVGK